MSPESGMREEPHTQTPWLLSLTTAQTLQIRPSLAPETQGLCQFPAKLPFFNLKKYKSHLLWLLLRPHFHEASMGMNSN